MLQLHSYLLLSLDVSRLKKDMRPCAAAASVPCMGMPPGPLYVFGDCRRSRIWPPWNVLRLAVLRGKRVLPDTGDTGIGAFWFALGGVVLKWHQHGMSSLSPRNVLRKPWSALLQDLGMNRNEEGHVLICSLSPENHSIFMLRMRESPARKLGLGETLLSRLWASIDYAVTHLTTRPCEIYKPQDTGFELSNCSEIQLMSWQQFCQYACQILKW